MIATLEVLLNPVGAVSAAWTAHLKKSIASVYPTFSDEDRKTPYIEVHLTNLRENGQKYPVNGMQVPNGWQATIVTRVATSRGVNGSKHGDMCGLVLRSGALFWDSFSEARLPHHLIQDMRLSGYIPSVEESTTGAVEDHTEIHHDVTIGVRDGSWQE